jgi:hypothetical protein
VPKVIKESSPSSVVWKELEGLVRTQAQAFIQRLLEEEVNELLGRVKSQRREPGSEEVYRNGHGKPRRPAGSRTGRSLREPRSTAVQAPHGRGRGAAAPALPARVGPR